MDRWPWKKSRRTGRARSCRLHTSTAPSACPTATHAGSARLTHTSLYLVAPSPPAAAAASHTAHGCAVPLALATSVASTRPSPPHESSVPTPGVRHSGSAAGVGSPVAVALAGRGCHASA